MNFHTVPQNMKVWWWYNIWWLTCCQKCFLYIDTFIRVKNGLTEKFLKDHSVEKREICSHWKKTSSNRIFCDFFRKNVTFAELLSKCACEWISIISTLCGKYVHRPDLIKVFSQKHFKNDPNTSSNFYHFELIALNFLYRFCLLYKS